VRDDFVVGTQSRVGVLGRKFPSGLILKVTLRRRNRAT